MSDQLATVQLSPIFTNLREQVEKLRDDILADGSKVLRFELESSIRLRWFDQGHTLGSLEEELGEDGNAKFYRLSPTAVSKRGAPYPLFGQYGTGRRGAASGIEPPAGYVYGQRQGMRARKFASLAVTAAKPKVTDIAHALTANFTMN